MVITKGALNYSRRLTSGRTTLVRHLRKRHLLLQSAAAVHIFARRPLTYAKGIPLTLTTAVKRSTDSTSASC
ncbi:MAG: hypothetical protein CMD83_07780 [Gammaproteobacteria bacterium]|nr:hypothetical protein [Gammaproteobacteria bacterium]